jgi:hypothetical protein
VGALHRVGTVEGLVQDEDAGRGDEGGGDLRPLAHALAEAADPTVGHVQQPDGLQRAVDGGRVVRAVEPRDVADQLPCRQHPGHRLVLGHERQGPVHLAVRPGVAPADPHGAGVGAEEAGDGPHQGRLARTAGAEQAGDAGPERAAQLGQGDLGAEPDREVGDLDRGVGDEGGIVLRREGGVAHASGSR